VEETEGEDVLLAVGLETKSTCPEELSEVTFDSCGPPLEVKKPGGAAAARTGTAAMA
jgi:hypothetical protein